tara:strand:+ start:24 stop:548 length:525 start_codon:yes stop_codon:yes gene_type:complete
MALTKVRGLGLGTLDDNLTFSTAGKGVHLGVTSATSSNLLDDYEEGTFTPVLNFGGSTTGIQYNAQVGQYTKIGDRVYLDIKIYLSSDGGGASSGNATITGIPFTTNSNNQYTASIYNDRVASTLGGPQIYNNGGDTTIQLFEMDDDSTNNAAIQNSEFTNTGFILIGMHYRTA